MIYTKNISNQKYFLNDKNIAQELVYGDIEINAIPSLDLVSSLYNGLSSEDKRLNDYLVSVETSAYTISSDVDARLLQLSNVLSSYSNELCANLSARVDENRVADKAELSNVLSTYSDSLCAAVSARVDENRVADKAELSNVLSTYTDSSVLNLSTDLSNSVNEQFVHLSGDTIDYINVKGMLSVASEALIDSNVRIAGSFVQGESVRATQKGGIALGISAEAKHTNSFVWNGNDNIENYESHGERGTFNINPEDGVDGFYIGQKTLSAIIHDDAQLTANSLTSQISEASTLVSAWVDADREADKAELSNVLSGYANSLCADLSARVDENRVADKAELSNTLSTYTNELTASLSNTVKNAGFAKAADTTFTYDEHDHKITLVMTDYLGTAKTMVIDTTDFIKNRIVNHVDVVTPSQDPSLSETVLRIWWTPEEGSTVGVYTDVPISQLAKVYTGADGITINDGLSIMVDSTVARTDVLNDVAATLNTVSAETVPALRDDMTTIQSYVARLSSDSVDNPGIVLTLSNSIKEDVQNLDTLSGDMKTLSANLTADIDTNRQDIAVIKEFDGMLSTVAGGVSVGAIPAMSHDISVLQERFNVATIYAGKIIVKKYHPDWLDAGYGNELSSILKFFNLADGDKVKNGSIFEIEFTPDTYTYDNPVFAADQTYVTDDGFQIAHKDWLYIVANPGFEYVDLTAITADNVRYMPAVKFYEKYELSNTVNESYIWLSGNNNTTATYEISVECEGRVPRIVTHTGHAIGGNNYIGGNNHFADGGNEFDGFNSVMELSAGALSASTLSANNTVVDKLSAYSLSADSLSAYSLSADEVLVYQLSANEMSTGTLSSDWNNIINSADGYTLFNLSTAVSSKIFIDDRVAGTSNTSDLSIVKISKSDYESLVADPTVQLDNSTLYIVESPCIDCYGQQIKNLADPTELSDATNKYYVNETVLAVSTALSTDYVDKIANLSDALSADIDTLSVNLSTDIDALSDNLSTDIDALSVNLSTEISAVRQVFNDLYSSINGISQNSVLSDIISAVVAIKDAIANLTAY